MKEILPLGQKLEEGKEKNRIEKTLNEKKKGEEKQKGDEKEDNKIEEAKQINKLEEKEQLSEYTTKQEENKETKKSCEQLLEKTKDGTEEETKDEHQKEQEPGLAKESGEPSGREDKTRGKKGNNRISEGDETEAIVNKPSHKEENRPEAGSNAEQLKNSEQINGTEEKGTDTEAILIHGSKKESLIKEQQRSSSSSSQVSLTNSKTTSPKAARIKLTGSKKSLSSASKQSVDKRTGQSQLDLTENGKDQEKAIISVQAE